MVIASSGDWTLGIVLGVVVILSPRRSSSRSSRSRSGSPSRRATAVEGVDACAQQTDELNGIARINDSGVRILHSARALRKVAVGK